MPRDKEQTGKILEKTAFPYCLIRETWDQSRNMALVADYIRWQAPESVVQFHNLYPEIIDRQQINAALVEARMMEAQIV
jgi:hypothetical protein